ncbi:MAG: hypothetical protein ACR2JF_14095 [Iamia sp.]
MEAKQSWPKARLIPVSGIGSQKEAETRAASAILAVLSIVRDLSVELFSPMGASRAGKAIVETFTAPQFALDGRKVRPDGLVRISYGQATWVALVEIKTGDMVLEPDQLNDYWDVARQEGFDAVVTISNEIASSPGAHPTAGLKVRSNSKVSVHHISWPALLSAAVMVKVHRGVADPEQAGIMGELIRYLEHPASGAMAFDDMGPNWTSVRDAARDDGLRKNDDAVREVAQRWDQLLRFAALRLGSRIGKDVQHVLSRAHQDPKVRSAHLVDAICSASPLEGTLRIPNTAGDLEVSADLKARRLTAAMSVGAPTDRGGRARCTWILNQLNDAPGELMVEAYPKNARTPTAVALSAAREDRDLLLGLDKREPVRFRLTLTTEMGMSRKTGTRTSGFIDSVTGLIEGFYGAIVQSVTPWAPKAPKITAPAAPPASDADGEPATGSIQQPSPYRFPIS